MRFKLNALALSTLLLLLGSCSYKNRNYLFNTPESGNSSAVKILELKASQGTTDYRHRIKVGDRLTIKFLNNYDIGGASGQSATATANSSLSGVSERGYLVNYDSTVVLPLIGRVNLCGLTRREASEKLEQEYRKFIVGPIIDLNISSLAVTVLGEVNIQGKVLLDKENTSLIDVIAMAGGIKDAGKKKNIKIIRGNQVILVNLKKTDALYDANIIMHDNDIVYVEPYRAKAATEPFVAVQPALSILTTTLQTLILITQFYLIYNK